MPAVTTFICPFFLGTARVLAQLKQQWSGTLVMLGQPAEETVGGAHAMLRARTLYKIPQAQLRFGASTTGSICPPEK